MDDLAAVGVTPHVLPYRGAPYEHSGVVQIGYVGLKLVAIYFILQILNISWFLETLSEGSRSGWRSIWMNFVQNGLPSVLQAFVGIILFRKAERWSPRIFGVPNTIVSPVDRDDAMMLIISGIGLLLLATGLPGLVENIATVALPSVMLGSNSADIPRMQLLLQLIADSGTRMIIGAIMFIFARKFADRWQRSLDRS